MSRYKASLLLFWQELREHGLKVAIPAVLALLVLLALFFRKLRAAGKAGQLPWDSLVILTPALVAFVVVALISPVKEPRYIYNLAPLLVAAVSFFIALLERSLGDFPRAGLWKHLALLALLALSLLAVKREPPRYVYPCEPYYVDSYAGYDALVEEHSQDPCLYLTGHVAPLTQDLGELLIFPDFFVTEDPDSPALDAYLARRGGDECVVYIDVNKFWSSGFEPEKMLPALLASTDFTEYELLYENGLSVAYLLRK